MEPPADYLYKPWPLAAIEERRRARMDSPDLPNVPEGYDLATYSPLTVSELVVLQLLSYGKMDIEIAEELHLSVHTIYSRTANIYSKMGLGEGKHRGASNRARAVGDGIRLGLIR